MKLTKHIRKRPYMYTGGRNNACFARLLLNIFQFAVGTLESTLIELEVKKEETVLRVSNIAKSIPLPFGPYYEQNSEKEESKKEESTNEKTQYEQQNIEAIPILVDLNVDVLLGICKNSRLQCFEKGNLTFEKSFEKGRKIDPVEKQIDHYDNMVITFVIDEDIMDPLSNLDYLIQSIRGFAFFYKKTTFVVKSTTNALPNTSVFAFKNGILDLLTFQKLKIGRLGNFYDETDYIIEHSFPTFDISIAFTLLSYKYHDISHIFSFVNAFETKEHGTHVDAIITGINEVMLYQHSINEIFSYEQFLLLEDLRKNIVLVVNLKHKSPKFAGSVCEKLTNVDIISPIKSLVIEHFKEVISSPKSFD